MVAVVSTSHDLSRLAGELVVVTGASRGIGRATAELLTRAGLAVLPVARDPRGLDPSPGALPPVAADLGTDQGIARVVEAVASRPLAGLVHAAGVCRLGRVEQTSAEDLDLQWQVNLRAPFLLTRALIPELRQRRGQVVFVNSGAGQSAKAGWSAYAVSKFGLRALADALRAELAPDGVRVTSVYPGRTATDMQAEVRRTEGQPYDPSIYVQPEDVARAIGHALAMAAPAVVEEISVRPLPAG